MSKNAKVTIIDNRPELLSALNSQLEKALWAIGATAEGYAKDECPVDTGRLRNSITHAEYDNKGVAIYSDNEGKMYDDGAAIGKPDTDEVCVGTNVEYAKINEFGDTIPHTSGRAHFLRDSIAQHTDEYKKIITAALKS